jgi:coenzyme PQQ synthesis protein D (PqqD)
MGETLSPQLLRRNVAIEEAPLQEELMLFNPVSSQFFVLNRTMAFAWKKLDAKASVEDIAVGITEAFAGVSLETALADVQKAVDNLMALGLIEPSV